MSELVEVDENIKNKIYTIRSLQVILDSDLAELYGVETKVLNQAVKRNIDRFPLRYRFQLTDDEFENLRFQNGTSRESDSLRSQIVTLESGRGKHRKYLPYVFTEQGVSMLSAVIKSERAIDVSIKIIDSFVAMRKFISQNAGIFQRLENVEQKLLKHDENFNKIFDAIEDKSIKPKQGIFFDGQIFDAYAFVSELIKSAKKSITLFDNYIELKKFDLSHDRFLLIDDELYHIGASLKDLGKKWFAFSKMEFDTLALIREVKQKG